MNSWLPDLRRHRLVGALASAMLLLVLAAASPANAQGETGVAGLVVDYGDGRVTYALVPVGDGEMSGIELLEESGIDLLTVEFGGMGQGVCMIENVGCDVGPCRARLCQTSDPDSPFWHYVQRAEAGEWEFAALGPSASTVRGGSVEGWYWSPGEPESPPPSIDDIAAQLDLDVAALETGVTEPVLLTVGKAPSSDEGTGQAEVMFGAAILALVTGIGLLVALRSRRRASP